MQNAELNCTEKCNTYLLITQPKKPRTKHGKSPKQNIYSFQNIVEKTCTKRLHKHAQSVHATPKQTWPTGSGIQKAKNNFPLQFLKTKVDQSKKN